jgi:hypothetical protein
MGEIPLSRPGCARSGSFGTPDNHFMGAPLERKSYITLIKTPMAWLVILAVTATTVAFAANADAASLGQKFLPPFPSQSRLGSSFLAGELAHLTHKGISQDRAREALAVQSEITRTQLIKRIEDGLGDTYAGVWFAPPTAQFHIAVTSNTSLATAERIVQEAGVASIVTYTKVHSTWAQLLATQSRWGRELAHLFAHQEAMTGIYTPKNAVTVALSSSVPQGEQDAIKLRAEADSVNVLVTIEQPSQLRITSDLATPYCPLPFKSGEAYCTKTITPGVLITEKKEAKPASYCTAGPLVVPKAKAKKGETFLLTAGHCTAGTLTKPWFSTEGALTEEIGPAESSTFGAKGDFGDILVKNPGFWSETGNEPVFDGTAEWGSHEEHAFAIEGEEPSAVGLQNCHEGATSGEQCGEVIGLNKEVAPVKGLVEDDACSEGGDSGGPWLNIGAGTTELRVDGTHSAKTEGPICSKTSHVCEFKVPEAPCRVFYMPIQVTLKELDMELLTNLNQNRKKDKENEESEEKGKEEKGKC